MGRFVGCFGRLFRHQSDHVFGSVNRRGFGSDIGSDSPVDSGSILLAILLAILLGYPDQGSTQFAH